MGTFAIALDIIIKILWAIIIGYTVATVWDMDRRAKRMEKLQHLMALKSVLQKTPAEERDDADDEDARFDAAMNELTKLIKKDDSEKDVEKKASKILKKYGLESDVKVIKKEVKKSTNKKGEK